MVRTEPRSRRSILTAALGMAGGAVAMSLGRPLAATATVATMETGTDNTSDATTRLLGPIGGTVVLGVAPTSMAAFESGGETVAIGTDKPAWPALNVVSTSDEEGLGMNVSAEGTFATGIRVVASQTGIESIQQNEFGSGVRGEAHGEQAAGVRGEGIGLATGGVFGAEQGTALRVNGRAGSLARAARSSPRGARTWTSPSRAACRRARPRCSPRSRGTARARASRAFAELPVDRKGAHLPHEDRVEDGQHARRLDGHRLAISLPVGLVPEDRPADASRACRRISRLAAHYDADLTSRTSPVVVWRLP